MYFCFSCASIKGGGESEWNIFLISAILGWGCSAAVTLRMTAWISTTPEDKLRSFQNVSHLWCQTGAHNQNCQLKSQTESGKKDGRCSTPECPHPLCLSLEMRLTRLQDRTKENPDPSQTLTQLSKPELWILE